MAYSIKKIKSNIVIDKIFSIFVCFIMHYLYIYYLMTDISYIIIEAASDSALIKTLGAFVKHHRVQQNKSQAQLAREAGIVRSTLSLFENGENTTLLVFVQLLRALKLLHILQHFEIIQELSPLQLAKLEHSQKKRVRSKITVRGKPEPKSDW